MKNFIVAALCCVMTAAEVDYGASEIYSRAEMDSAIRLVQEMFSNWRGCEMKNIRYGGDEANNAENLRWMNNLAPAHGYAPEFTQCIEFLTDFYVSPEAEKYTTFNPDSVYKDFQWWLARTKDGDWVLLTFGY